MSSVITDYFYSIFIYQRTFACQLQYLSTAMPEDTPTKKEDGTDFFSPPIQRQKWGDTQILPHTNWGDLFFDLFYVAAAYNLSTIIKADPTAKGLFYFLALFGPVFSTFWVTKMSYDSRFEMPNDIVHRILEVLQLCALATSVIHIRPVEYMSHGADNSEIFLYCLGLCIGNFINLLYQCEIRFVWVVGQVAAKRSAGRDMKYLAWTFLLHTSALVYSANAGRAGVEYHGPLIILLVEWLTRPWVMLAVLSTVVDLKTFSVPMNIDFTIHRYGEWTMLMLGESILSLLIVNDVSSEMEKEFYFTFYLGILSVTLLQFLYFKSQPHDADHHAMRRSRLSGILFSTVIQFYSASLILVGVSYKMLLTEYTSAYADSSYGGSYGSENRLLASSAGATDTYTTKERQQRIANLFCFALAAVFLFLDVLTIAHSGFSALSNRCHCKEGNFQMKGFALVVFSRIVIIIFLATLSQYISDPELIVLIGFGTIVMQVTVRFLGRVYFPSKQLHAIEDLEFKKEEIQEERWPNTTQPRSIPEEDFDIEVEA